MDTGERVWRVVLRWVDWCDNEAECVVCGDIFEPRGLVAELQDCEPYVVRDHGPVCRVCLCDGRERALERLRARTSYWRKMAIALAVCPVVCEAVGERERCEAASMRERAEAASRDAERFDALALGLSEVSRWPSADEIERIKAELELECSRVIELFGPVAKRARRVADDNEDVPF